MADENAFWFSDDQMALPRTVRGRLAVEGLEYIRDFEEFKEDQLTQAFKNIRMTIPAAAGIQAELNDDGTEIFPAVPPIPAQPGLIISAKCSMRLKIASKAWHYYKSIDRAVTPLNMHFVQVLKDFNIEHEAITKRAKIDKPDVPKITRNTTPLRWIESFNDCLYRTFGIRDCPLSYVTRANNIVPSEIDDPLLPRRSFGISGSVVEELVKRMT